MSITQTAIHSGMRLLPKKRFQFGPTHLQGGASQSLPDPLESLSEITGVWIIGSDDFWQESAPSTRSAWAGELRASGGMFLPESQPSISPRQPASASSLSDGFLSRVFSTTLSSRMRELMALPAGWDGERARPVRMEAVLSVIELLQTLADYSDFKLPFVAPTFEGYLLLDWTSELRTLELEAERDGWSIVGTLNANTQKKDYFSATIRGDPSNVLKYYRWFKGDLDVWPTA